MALFVEPAFGMEVIAFGAEALELVSDFKINEGRSEASRSATSCFDALLFEFPTYRLERMQNM